MGFDMFMLRQGLVQLNSIPSQRTGPYWLHCGAWRDRSAATPAVALHRACLDHASKPLTATRGTGYVVFSFFWPVASF